MEKLVRPVTTDKTAELIDRIRQGLKKIDENLLGAKVDDTAEGMRRNIRDMEKLLEDTRGRSAQVIQDLDELIRGVKYKQCGSGGAGQQPPNTKKPEQQESNQRRDEDQSDDPQKNADSREENRDEPKDGKPDDRSPEQRQAGDKPPPEKDPERVKREDLSGRWGILPPKIQQDILNFNIDYFPQKYRKWLEDYYRRINRRARR